jgi:pyruvate dehydrogenase E1 component alpha subunit
MDGVEEQKQKDPITRFIELLKDNGQLTDEELKTMDAEIQKVCDEAAEFADNSPEPGLEDLYTHVYATEDVHGRLFFDRKNRLEQG